MASASRIESPDSRLKSRKLWDWCSAGRPRSSSSDSLSSSSSTPNSKKLIWVSRRGMDRSRRIVRLDSYDSRDEWWRRAVVGAEWEEINETMGRVCVRPTWSRRGGGGRPDRRGTGANPPEERDESGPEERDENEPEARDESEPEARDENELEANDDPDDKAGGRVNPAGCITPVILWT
ncbi:hypothetical protein RSAG8_08428, partial [Rhizoctonia solani AG-8 WAC10335]